MSTRHVLACGALAVVVLAATAGDRWWSNQTATPLTSAGPEPITVAPPPPAFSPGQAPVAAGCNPRASLRPHGPLPVPGQMPAGSTMARIAQRGFLIAGIDQDIHQFAFRDENLRLEGFDIDIVRDIAEAIFGDRERVVFRSLTEAERPETARSDRVDLVVATFTITCQRREQVAFSTAYYEAGQRVLVNRGSAATGLVDLAGKRVCAGLGTTSLGKILAATPKLIAVGVPSPTECLVMLQLGEVDAISTDDTLLAGMAAQDPQTEIISPRLTEEPYGVATKKDNPDLVRFVNAVLERRVQDGRWGASYERWLRRLGPPPAPPIPQYQD
jgi:polar amino acid transport system substrate-binding protein